MRQKLVDEGPIGQVVAGLLVADDEQEQARTDEGDDDVGDDVGGLDPVPRQQGGVEVVLKWHFRLIGCTTEIKEHYLNTFWDTKKKLLVDREVPEDFFLKKLFLDKPFEG